MRRKVIIDAPATPESSAKEFGVSRSRERRIAVMAAEASSPRKSGDAGRTGRRKGRAPWASTGEKMAKKQIKSQAQQEWLPASGVKSLEEAVALKAEFDRIKLAKDKASHGLSCSKVPDSDFLLMGLKCLENHDQIRSFIGRNSEHVRGLVENVNAVPYEIRHVVARCCLGSARSPEDVALSASTLSRLIVDDIVTKDDYVLQCLDVFRDSGQKPSDAAVSYILRNYRDVSVVHALLKVDAMNPGQVNRAVERALDGTLLGQEKALCLALRASKKPSLLAEVDLIKLVPQGHSGEDFIEIARSGCDVLNREAAIDAFASEVIKGGRAHRIVEFARAFPDVQRKEVRDAIAKALSGPPVEELVESMISGRPTPSMLRVGPMAYPFFLMGR